MCKSSSLAFVLLFALLFRLEPPSLRLVAIIATIIVSIDIMVFGEITFSARGFILVILAAFFSGFRWDLTQILLWRNPATSNSFASYQQSEKLVAFNEFKTVLRKYKEIITRNGGARTEVIERLYTALLECVACDAFDNETRNEPLVERYCKSSATELSNCLAKLFPPCSDSVAKRSQALKDVKKVFDRWGPYYPVDLWEEAEEATLMNLEKLGARKGQLFAGHIAILVEFKHLKKSFDQLLVDKEIWRTVDEARIAKFS